MPPEVLPPVAPDARPGAPRWRVVAGSVRGTSHAATGAPCQDASEAVVRVVDGEEVLILAVADGAGSAAHSDVGSALACAAVVGEVGDFLDRHPVAAITREIVEAWYLHVHLAVTVHAQELGVPTRELACTLLLAVVSPTRAVCAQVGDGAIVLDASSDDYAPATWPQSGEYANMTHFATEPEALRHLQVVVVDRPVEEVALFSDGIEKLALQIRDRHAHAPFFRPLFGQLRQQTPEAAAQLGGSLQAFLDSPAVNERTDDDKTLVLATRRVAARGVATPA